MKWFSLEFMLNWLKHHLSFELFTWATLTLVIALFWIIWKQITNRQAQTQAHLDDQNIISTNDTPDKKETNDPFVRTDILTETLYIDSKTNQSQVLTTDLTDDVARQIEQEAMRVVRLYEEQQGQQVTDVSIYYCGYDYKSEGLQGTKHIEVKGKKVSGDIIITKNEWETAKLLGSDYYLYIVEEVFTESPFLKIIRNPSKYVDTEPYQNQFILPRSQYVSTSEAYELFYS